ncbi:MAG: hypothetical protein QUS11_03785 [Candidatus Fermentibacter sp.]|nr:hypothetical protein [Candidatus Fermentibacter sp.]
MSAEESLGKIRWLWKEIEGARDRGDPEGEREGLERLLADPAVKATPDEDLAILSVSRLDLIEGRARDAAQRMAGFQWHGVPGPASLLLASDVFLRLDWFDPARECLEEYAKSCPEDLDARRKLGLSLLLLDRDPEAERALLAVARREQNSVPATLAYLALLEAKRGRLEESLHLLIQARDLAPFDSRIEHTLLRIEALRVSTKRRVMSVQDPAAGDRDMVPGMAAGMMQVHGYGRDLAEKARALWDAFLESRGSAPAGRKPAIWAAALEYAVTMNGPHYTQEELAAEYGVSESRLKQRFGELSRAVDLEAFNRADLLARTASEGRDLLLRVKSSGLSDVLASLAARLGDFSSPADAVEWVLSRSTPQTDSERAELEEFVAWMWKGRTRRG